MQRSPAYTQGYEAYLGPMRDKTNPYPEGSEQHSQWWEGFNNAQADYSV
jgi:ribosome modulation factor